jgi:hypothetical protein
MTSHAAEPGAERGGTVDTVAGFLASFAIFAAVLSAMSIEFTISSVSIAFRPVRVGVAAELVALVAVGMSRGRNRIAGFAAGFCGLCWFVGMVVAVTTNRPLW